MKKTVILILGLLAVFSCKEAEDTRYFAPEIAFKAETFSATAEDGSAEVVLSLSRPATIDFSVSLVIKASLTEGTQFTAPHSVDIKAGDTQAVLKITLVNEEIWDENSWIDIILTPGPRYTVNPSATLSTRVEIVKATPLPILSLTLVDGEADMNPYRPQPLTLKLSSTKAFDKATEVKLSAGDYEFLIDGVPGGAVTMPAGATEASFVFTILKIDRSGMDETVAVGPALAKGVYLIAADGTTDIHLSDPVPNFSKLLSKKPIMGSLGYQIRQSIKKGDGEWDVPEMAGATYAQAAEGSCYLSSVLNTQTDYGCISSAVGGLTLRIKDFFPTFASPSDIRILGYGKGENTRPLSPVDSLFRFVLDKGSETQGDIVLDKPRKFYGRIGSDAAWKDAWVADSNSTGGDFFASTSPILTRWITVTLERLEGRFDVSNVTETMIFSAWFSSDAEEFMDGVDFEKIGAVKEGDLWKVDYKLWPRS